MTRIERRHGQITPFDLNPDIDYSILPNPAARATALAQPTAVVFDPGGQFMYVAAFGTDRVARVDTERQRAVVRRGRAAERAGSNADPEDQARAAGAGAERGRLGRCTS